MDASTKSKKFNSAANEPDRPLCFIPNSDAKAKTRSSTKQERAVMVSPLDAERKKSGLSAREIAYVLHNGQAHVEKLERLEALLVADPEFNHDNMNYLARGEQYRR